MDKVLKDISSNMIKRYSDRYSKMGYDVKTLGWGTEEQQFYRFAQTLELSTQDKNILDIGCGFGDYYTFLKQEQVQFKNYTGFDLNQDLVVEARAQHAESKDCNFEVHNMLEELDREPIADIGIMLGVLNLNFKGEVDNYEYSRNVITNALSLVKECLVVDFLSDRLTPDYPNEDFVFYHDPVKMFEFALSLSHNVRLKHDYAPIPQKEFMIFIYK